MAEINVSLKLDDKYADDMKKIMDDVISAVEKIKANELEKYVSELEELGDTYTINNQQAAENTVSTGEAGIKELNDTFLFAVRQTIPEFTKDAIIRNTETYTDWIISNIEMQSSIPKAYATNVNKEINKLIAETGKELEIAITDPKLVTEIKKDLNNFTKEAIRRGEKITAAKIDFWSRDQVGYLVRDQTKALFDNYNLETYIWRTRGDNRVRPDHAVMDGVIVPFGKSPIGVEPGEDWACRCGYDVNEREIKDKI